MTAVVATANIKVTLPRDVAGHALTRILDAGGPTIVGLQEWGTARNRVLTRIAREHGYTWTRPRGCGPVMWDTTCHHLISARARRIARGGFMGRLPGRRTTLPDSLAALVILADDQGRETCVLNVHLTAEVQYGTGYRTSSTHAARVRRHKREVRTIANIARRQRRKGRTVIVLGDFNYHGLVIPGLVSCWEGRHGGTLGNRAVDVVYTSRHADSLTTIPTASDHRAVVVGYLGGIR